MGQPAPKDLSWKISSALATQWAGVDDPSVRHGLDRRRNVFPTALAADNKVMQLA
jgi:hypothetical protein